MALQPNNDSSKTAFQCATSSQPLTFNVRLKYQMHVRAFPVMPTRPCGLCFALQDDSVFADFDIDEKSQLYLVRISFDGYGCCHPGWSNTPVKMPLGDSQKLLRFTEADDLTHPDVASIFSSYFIACGEAIWVDALQNHGLI